MKIISWNVNGLRAVCKKGFLEWFRKIDADIICLQEIKAKEDQVPVELLELNGYFSYFNPAQRPGYAGTAVFTKEKPLAVEKTIGFKRIDEEGRMLRLKFKNFELFNFYIINGMSKEQNMIDKLASYDFICKELSSLPQILLGDFNVAHKEIDLARPEQNKNTHGFTLPEREKIDKLLEAGFTDTLREFNKESGNYTWWSYYRDSRKRNVGWRIDYCFVSKALTLKLKDAFILPQVTGSDHCPIGIDINL